MNNWSSFTTGLSGLNIGSNAGKLAKGFSSSVQATRYVITLSVHSRSSSWITGLESGKKEHPGTSKQLALVQHCDMAYETFGCGLAGPDWDLV